MSDLETAIWQPFKENDVIVLGISSEDEQDIKQFVAAQGITFPVLRDAGNAVYRNYFLYGGISPYPRDFIIDREGILQYKNTEYDANTMKLIVEGLINNTNAIKDEGQNVTLPEDIELKQNYPNPFNANTKIIYELAKEMDIRLSVINLMGQNVVNLVSKRQDAGQHAISWDGKDLKGRSVPSGIYFYQLKTGSITVTKKMFLIR